MFLKSKVLASFKWVGLKRCYYPLGIEYVSRDGVNRWEC